MLDSLHVQFSGIMELMTQPSDIHLTRYQLINLVLDTVALVYPNLSLHMRQVGYICCLMGQSLGLKQQELEALVMAGLLHDLGALNIPEHVANLEFERVNPRIHMRISAILADRFEWFQPAAALIRYHHYLRSDPSNFKDIGINSTLLQILRVSDLLAEEACGKAHYFSHIQQLVSTIDRLNVGEITPDVINACLTISEIESYWFDLTHPDLAKLLNRRMAFQEEVASLPLLESFSVFLLDMMSLWSEPVSIHSAAVASAASFLAKGVGVSEAELTMIRIAGHLHDLGKMGVPLERLDKAAAVTTDEYNEIKIHAYLGWHLLSNLSAVPLLQACVGLHHERLDGNGYPFHRTKEDIPFLAQIISVADIYAAISEDRPYRGQAKHIQMHGILEEMKLEGHNPQLIDLAIANQDTLAYYCAVARERILVRHRTLVSPDDVMVPDAEYRS